jgi:hypothetical protein
VLITDPNPHPPHASPPAADNRQRAALSNRKSPGVSQWGMHGAVIARTRPDEYFVVTRSRGRPPVWTWQIQRRPRPLGVIFETETAAKLAGEKALVEFLDRLADEDNDAV